MNKNMTQKRFFSLFLTILLYSPAFCQNPDSLLAVVDTAQGPLKVKTLNELFRAHLMSDPVKAVGYSREALILATEIDDKRGMAASYNNLGVAYRNQGALDKALEYYMTSMKLYDSLQNKEGVATTKNNIANIYSIKKDYAQAMRYLEESYSIFQEMGDPFRLIGSMNNLGNLYHDIDLNEKALEYYTEAYALSEKNGARFGDPLNNVGNIYFHQGNYPQAIRYYEQALDIERANNNKLAVLNTLTNIGITYTKAKKPANAEKYLGEALKISQELQALTALPSIYKARGENFSLQNRWKEAYQMQLKYDELREKIYGEESSRNIAQMEMVLDFQEKEREIEMMRKEGEIRSLELRNSRLFIILIILGVIVIIGGANFFYMDRKRKLV
ncbi:MAG TPA: tetratricopeptide repeat protein [Chryseosolibacter sp.]|nr:tetratricopeptide repeat protein [Chryseosolibacter sp.]